MGGRTVFSRVSGGIVLDSFSIVSLFTGILAALPAGLLLLIGSSGPRSGGIGAAVSVVWGVTVLVFVSRFAQLGIAGDSEGGLLSGSAGPWSGTFLAAGRLLVLWAVWALPFVAWALLKAEPEAPAGFPGMGMGLALLGAARIPFLLALWSALGMVLSFAFVAVSAAAPNFGDLFSPGLWRTLFAGRAGELFVAIAGTFGPPVTVFAFVLPVIVGFVPVNPKAALTGTIPFLLYALGMVLTLQGKLCGAFAAASLVEEGEVAEVFEAVLPAEAHGTVAAVPALVHTAAPAAETPGPVLGDPKHLHTVWQTRLSAGDAEGALETAREAIPAGLAKREPRLAAEIYRRHLDRLPELGLDRTALDLLADQLLRDGDVAAAAWTFSQALDTEPTDPKAFKGLLRVAEHHLDKAKEPLEAIRVYQYLLERAPASPFADHARDLLGSAERRAARPAAP
jgi:hypothetical protein